MNIVPGGTCPTTYCYGAKALALTPITPAETLYVVGGLYGNPFALNTVLTMAAAETGPVTICFNGDFNWFNVDDDSFQRINLTVLQHQAIQGNVEFEFSSNGSSAGCGCAYPEAIGQHFVDRSNRIHVRLKNMAIKYPQIIAQLANLPLFSRYQIGETKIGIVHGDAYALAGWLFDVNKLGDPSCENKIITAFDEANVDIFASSHTCLPALRRFTLTKGSEGIVANNGAAGMPNFRGPQSGLLTRVSARTSPHTALYGVILGDVHIDALSIEYDHSLWTQHFLSNWPPGSDAHTSYFARIANGPEYQVAQALRRFDGRTFCHQ